MTKIFLFVFTFALNATFAQSSSTLIGARAASMGYASATLADEWSLFNNTAGLAKVKQSAATFAYDITPGLVGANRIAAGFATPSKIGTFGLGVFRFGDDLYSEQFASLGIANQVGNTSLGLKVNYIQYRAEGFGMVNTGSIDFGGITKITPQISIGSYITNLTQSKLVGATDAQRLPTRLVAGVGIKPTENIFIVSEIDKDLDFAATWRTGIEYALYKKIFFRTGFNMNPNAAFFGLGGQKKNLKFDYAIKFSQLLGATHQASAAYLIPLKTGR